MRCSGRFVRSGHEPNTYLLFGQVFAEFISKNGRAGVVVKSAFGLDQSASEVFRGLVRTNRVAAFHDFINGGVHGPIFPAVGEPVRFAVVALVPVSSRRRDMEVTTLNMSIAEARSRNPALLSANSISIFNPVTGTLVSHKRQTEFDVALRLHADKRRLECERGGENPWGVKFLTLFHSSGGAKEGHFLKREELEAEGWVLGVDRVFTRASSSGVASASTAVARASSGQMSLLETKSTATACERAVPLYEGQLVNRYDHRAKTYEGYVGANKYGKKPGIPECTDEQRASPFFEIEPRYWVPEDVVNERYKRVVDPHVGIAFRDTGAPWTNRRSARASLMPRYGATHKLPLFAVPRQRAWEFLAVWNSTTFDFLARGHLPEGSLALLWMLAQIPAPLPGLDPRISNDARKLSLTSYSVCAQFSVEPHPWNMEERYLLDTELDALVAHAYGLTRAEYEVVLDSFEVLARIEMREKGRYQFKDDCLAAYGRVG